MTKTDEIVPIEKLAAVILNNASDKHAEEVLIELLHGPVELTDELLELLKDQDDLSEQMKNSSIAVNIRNGEDWNDVKPPPVYLWSTLRNIFLRWAGIEYWKKGPATGRIDEHLVNQAWEFSISEDHNTLKFEPITSG